MVQNIVFFTVQFYVLSELFAFIRSGHVANNKKCTATLDKDFLFILCLSPNSKAAF